MLVGSVRRGGVSPVYGAPSLAENSENGGSMMQQTRPDTRCQGGEIGAFSVAPGKVGQHILLPVICGEVEIPGCLNKTHTSVVGSGDRQIL